MGDSSSSKPRGGSSDTPATPANPNPTSTVQPFMPGMDQMLAQQLAAGFGGTPQDFLTAFAQTYAPMQVPQNAVFTPPKDSKSSSSDSGGSKWDRFKDHSSGGHR